MCLIIHDIVVCCCYEFDWNDLAYVFGTYRVSLIKRMLENYISYKIHLKTRRNFMESELFVLTDKVL